MKNSNDFRYGLSEVKFASENTSDNYFDKYYNLCYQMHEEKMKYISEKSKVNQHKFYLQLAVIILLGILINTFIIIA